MRRILAGMEKEQRNRRPLKVAIETGPADLFGPDELNRALRGALFDAVSAAVISAAPIPLNFALQFAISFLKPLLDKVHLKKNRDR